MSTKSEKWVWWWWWWWWWWNGKNSSFIECHLTPGRFLPWTQFQEFSSSDHLLLSAKFWGFQYCLPIWKAQILTAPPFCSDCSQWRYRVGGQSTRTICRNFGVTQHPLYSSFSLELLIHHSGRHSKLFMILWQPDNQNSDRNANSMEQKNDEKLNQPISRAISNEF